MRSRYKELYNPVWPASSIGANTLILNLLADRAGTLLIVQTFTKNKVTSGTPEFLPPTVGALPSVVPTYRQPVTLTQIDVQALLVESEQSDIHRIFQPVQSSAVSLTHSQSDQEDSSRSSSPNPPSSPRRTRRPSPLHFSKRERPSITPISSYVRRKTPQNSPIVLTFAQREYVERPEIITPPSLMPMSLPTIPPIPR
ncbi:hypothetical protein DEU56DRAFT_909699 [Suillus clintonianus]|uniref:uncharacterized protein n=1 Tax=Suillus clintonianus TaxID=1904413 RepID=UPI001B8731D6|nr:uncharacterized protein DEU56DRAFT_909699 [Suillus clintonianus]KAG2146645.1 hypothetical protein DEU56DRAFT_909699 [Suillus clintonianus]